MFLVIAVSLSLLFANSSLTAQPELPVSYLPNSHTVLVKHFQSEKYEECLTVLNKLLTNKRIPGELPKLFFIQGVSLQRLGRDKEAIEAFNRSLSYQGANSATLYFRALSEEALGEFNTAVTTVSEALWFKRYSFLSEADFELKRGELYVKLGKLPEARLAFAAALKHNNDLTEARLELAKITENTDEARAMLGQVLKVNPDNEDAALILAKNLIESAQGAIDSKNLATAQNILSDLLSSPETSRREEALALQVSASIKQGNIKEATSNFTKALAQFPTSSTLIEIGRELKIAQNAAK